MAAKFVVRQLLQLFLLALPYYILIYDLQISVGRIWNVPLFL